MQRRNKGFTLLELIITITLLGIISVVVGRIVFHGYQTASTAENIGNADWEGFVALERIANDIHTVRSALDIGTISSSQLSFVDVSGNTVTYQLSGNTLLRNSTTLASGVTTLSFAYYDNNGASTGVAANVRYIAVSLVTSQGGISLPASTFVGTRGMS